MDPRDHPMDPDPYLLEYQEFQEDQKPNSPHPSFVITADDDESAVINSSQNFNFNLPESTSVMTKKQKRRRKSALLENESKLKSESLISDNQSYLHQHRKQLRKLMKYRVAAAKEKAKICYLKRVKLERALDIKIEYPFQARIIYFFKFFHQYFFKNCNMFLISIHLNIFVVCGNNTL